ncbi:MAG: glycoside hydrolase [Deltaproteobacteria bacterium]|nr:glycoside hydrolase [Deltaproteobacteria bacterium]
MLTLLLHMHQPDYRHPATGQPIMPWVRLHATRGYRDVPRIVAASGARVTVNLVATLTEQVDRYVAGGSDLHLDLCRAPASDLADAERRWVLEHCFHGSPRAYGWFRAWGELRRRRDAGDHFTAQDLRDVQCWCNLAWFGATALEDMPELAELRRKARGFSEDDQSTILAAQARCLRELRPLYAALPEVSASPYAHPILPLLVNTAHARRCMDDLPDPGFAFPADALDQLRAGRDRVASWVGHEVAGTWPSEGSVSPEVVGLLAEAGFRWFATDEGILDRSDRSGKGPAWQVGPLVGLFRDRALSDRVGFTYADWPGERAAADLAGRVGEGAVLVLDGENPWESYPDAGAGFLRALFAQVRTRTCGETAREPSGRVSRLHTGSWIDANFRIWIGHEEDREAWRQLAAARALLGDDAPAAAREAMWRAEASDWTWWYGDDFDTPFAGEFDVLFRAHLRAVYAALGRAPPPSLDQPIKNFHCHVRAPVGDVAPGRDDHFAWSAGGHVDVTAGSMAPSPDFPTRLRYGWEGRTLHLQVDAPGWRLLLDGRDVGGPSVATVHDRTLLRVQLLAPDGRRWPEGGHYVLPPPVERPE